MVAYLASDLRETHPVGQLMSRCFERHSRRHFEVRCLDTSGGRTELSARVRAGCDRVHAIGSTAAATDEIFSDIDLLIDLNGHTEGSRTDLLASSRAPVKSLAIAYPASLGGHHLVDYLIGDAISLLGDATSTWPQRSTAPPPSLYPERLVLLPRFFLAADHHVTFPLRATGPQGPHAFSMPPPPRHAPCALSSFSQMYKLRPSTLETWLSVVRRLPAHCSILLLRFQPASVPKLRDEAAALGLASTRVRWLSMRPRAEHIARAGSSSLLSLDTPGYNQGTSGLDALWAGLPLVTLPLRAWCERMGASLVRSYALPSGEVHSLRAMSDVALALASEERQTTRTSSRRATRDRWRVGATRVPIGIEVGA